MDSLLTTMMFGGSSSNTNIKWILKTYSGAGVYASPYYQPTVVGTCPDNASFALLLSSNKSWDEYSSSSSSSAASYTNTIPINITPTPTIAFNYTPTLVYKYKDSSETLHAASVYILDNNVSILATVVTSNGNASIGPSVTVLIAFGIET